MESFQTENYWCIFATSLMSHQCSLVKKVSVMRVYFLLRRTWFFVCHGRGCRAYIHVFLAWTIIKSRDTRTSDSWKPFPVFSCGSISILFFSFIHSSLEEKVGREGISFWSLGRSLLFLYTICTLYRLPVEIRQKEKEKWIIQAPKSRLI
jgi:hypothetical protein